MFQHFHPRGKCEWRAGGLDVFVKHYNEKNGTAYSLSACLDVVRINGSTAKAPEVLLTDSGAEKQMVVERKSIVWPPNYIQRHRLEDDFAESIWAETGDLYRDAAYRLTVDGREFDVLSPTTVQKAGRDIGGRISHLDPTDLPINSANPIRWWFRKAQPGEPEVEQKGITVTLEDSITLEDMDGPDARGGTLLEMKAQLESAAAKFANYSQCHRVVLLDFYGSHLWEDDIPPLLKELSVPDVIDEVWRSVRDWISEDDYQIGYERLDIVR
jgi:hypothetical protein